MRGIKSLSLGIKAEPVDVLMEDSDEDRDDDLLKLEEPKRTHDIELDFEKF